MSSVTGVGWAFIVMSGVAVVSALLWLNSESKLAEANNRLKRAQKFEPKRDRKGRFIRNPINGLF